MTHVGGLSDTVAFTWDISGTKTITVTASNVDNIVTNTHVITVYAPVHAEFTASPTSGFVPLAVVFANASSGDYTASLWSFGDGATNTLPSPSHIYTDVGVYTVTLVVEGPLNSDTETKVAYIGVWQCYKIFLPLVLRNP
jgi:PKD repeat protein